MTARTWAARSPGRGSGSTAPGAAGPGRARSRAPRRASGVRPVDLQRLRLAAGAVEGEHQLPAQTLLQRVLGDERLELPDQVDVPAERQIGVDPLDSARSGEAPRDGRSRRGRTARRRSRRAALRARVRAPRAAAATRARGRRQPAPVSLPRSAAGNGRGRAHPARPAARSLAPASANGRRPARGAAARRSSGGSSRLSAAATRSQSSSISVSVDNDSFGWMSRSASTARCLPPPIESSRSSSRTSSGPRMRKSICLAADRTTPSPRTGTALPLPPIAVA